jgi:CRP/FNR family transcriptional regulator, cyclic AMP receptor protein
MGRLTGVALLKDLTLDLAPFEARARWRRFAAGEIIVDFDDLSTDVYFILAGDVRILIRTPAGKEVILGEMRAGALFGELAALDGIPRSANVTALTRGELCVMSAPLFKELVFSTPPIAERLFKLLTARIRELNARLTEHTILDLRHRLYAELLRLSIPRGNGSPERVLSPPPYHHVLAARIGCRREQVTREFTTLAKEGLIERTRGALVLKRPAILEAKVAEAMREEE